MPEGWGGWWRRALAWSQGDKKKENSYRAILLLLLLGALLVVWDRPQAPDAPAQPTSSAAATGEAVEPALALGRRESPLEQEVERALSQIAGVGQVTVTIVYKTSETLALAEEVTHRTSRSTGGNQGGQGGESFEESVTRRPIIVQNDAEKRGEPVALYSERPQVAGALVAADGALDPSVRYMLLQAVSTLLDVPSHRVEVVPRR